MSSLGWVVTIFDWGLFREKSGSNGAGSSVYALYAASDGAIPRGVHAAEDSGGGVREGDRREGGDDCGGFRHVHENVPGRTRI